MHEYRIASLIGLGGTLGLFTHGIQVQGCPMESRPSLSGAGYEVWGDRGIRWAGGPVDKRMIVELVIKGWVWEGFTPPKGIPERL